MEPLGVGADPGPNKAMRKMLAERWKQLPEEKKITLRAARAKSGVKCVICGKIGYYMENCPNGCTSPPGTPDSWASTPPGTPPKSPIGLGVLWGDRSGQNESSPDYLKKVDVNTVRPQAQKEQKRLHELDEKVGTFAFFAESEEGYADNYSQLTLHQVMRRLMRLLERQLHQNTAELEAKFDTTLLHPPKEKISGTFYPEELKKVKEYRDYFIEKETKKEHKKIYRNQSSVRCADELDPLFRGGSTADDFLYKVNPQAGASMHSKNTWKSVLSHTDDLATSDPTMAKKEAKLQTLFNNQSKWIKLQQTGMTHKNDRFEHLVNILREEMKQEHSREATLLATSKHGTRAMQMKVYQERLESVDRIMSCLNSYNFTSGLDEADFLLFCFDRWKQTLHGKVYGKNLHRRALQTTVNDDNITVNDDGNASVQHSISSSTVGFLKKKDKNNPNAGTGLNYNRMIAAANPYAQDLAFLQYMKRKHHNMRVKAMEGSGIEIADYTQSHLQGHGTQRKKHSKGQGEDDDDDDMTDDLGNPIRLVRKPSVFLTGDLVRTVSSGDPMVEAAQKGFLRNTLSAGASTTSLLSTATASLASIDETSAPLQVTKRGTGALATRASSSGQKGHTGTKGPTVLKRRKHQREIDADNIDEAKGAFRRAGLKGHIRAGVDDDLAYLAPTLIPVPGAFQADGSNPMSSHTAENILFKVKKNMILGDIGYTPQSMLPLYVRNTLIEKNGTTPGGDQAYDVMSTDRRYSHYVGRPLNRFEPEESKLKMDDGFAGINEEILRASLSNPSRQMKLMTSALAKSLQGKPPPGPRPLTKRELQHQAELEKQAQAKKEHRQERRLIHEEMEKAKGLPLTKSLVRMAFRDPLPSLASLAFIDD